MTHGAWYLCPARISGVTTTNDCKEDGMSMSHVLNQPLGASPCLPTGRPGFYKTTGR